MGSNLDHEIFLQQGDVVERAIELPGPQDRAGSGIDQLRGDAEILAHSADIAFEQVVMELAGSPFHTATPLHAVRVLLERRCAIGGSTDPGQRLRLLHSEVVARGLDPVSLVSLLASVLGLDSQTDFDPTSAEWSECPWP